MSCRCGCLPRRQPHRLVRIPPWGDGVGLMGDRFGDTVHSGNTILLVSVDSHLNSSWENRMLRLFSNKHGLWWMVPAALGCVALLSTAMVLVGPSAAAALQQAAPPETSPEVSPPPVTEDPPEAAQPEDASGEPETTNGGTEADEDTEATEEEPTPTDVLRSEVDVLWTCLAAFLVFFMQPGFMLVEAGYTRGKNAVNIVMKNLADFSVGSLSFWLVGFGLMFGANPDGVLSGWVGVDGFYYHGETAFDWAFLIFQTVFAATAATIVSGAMAERTKFASYLIFSAVITIVIYPVFGHWAWGGLVGNTGWLEGIAFLPVAGGGEDDFTGMIDFAGSTVVHSIGAWAALAGAIVVGPRRGKYQNGKPMAIPGQNIPMAALGTFILWLGWFGFNPGSTTAVGGGDIALIAVNTNLAAAAGALAALLTAWGIFGKPDPTFALNGVLAGLVGITAGCANAAPEGAVLIGAISGVLVVFGVIALERCGIDDPVGAVSVHGICGAWGTIAIGFLATDAGLLYRAENGVNQVIAQFVGVIAGFVWAFFTSLIVFLLLKFTIGLRVSEQEEREGLDVAEHGITAYPPSLIAEGSN